MTGLLGPDGQPLTRPVVGPLGQLAEPIECGSEGCTNVAVAALWLRDQVGHVHDCKRHEALVREHCDVVASKPITPGMKCPALACTPTPIHTSLPRPL